MREMYGRLLTFTLVFTLFAGLRPGAAGAVDPDSLHWAAWDNALAVADQKPALRYAFYAYRTVAVPHPEIYLLADALFSEIVETMPGSRAAYRGGDVRSVELHRRLLKGEQQGPSFTWRMWAPVADSIYDPLRESERLSWLDRRLPSAAVLLRAFSPRMSTAEAAMMRYTQLRRSGSRESNLFVLIDTAGHGYVAHDDLFITPATGLTWDGDPATVVPALVFNERSVYYPLFGRDDRSEDSALARLLDRLTTPAALSLSAQERARVDSLQSAAALRTGAERQLAVIAAIGGSGIENALLRDAWRGVFNSNEGSGPLGCEKSMLRMAFYWADRLSRKTALLATAAFGLEFDSATAAWEQTYLSWCGRRVNPRDTADLMLEAGGFLWAYELLEITFDDIIRTRTGPPSSQALAMSAALDLLGIPNIRLEVDMPEEGKRPDQHWVLAEEGRWQFNLGNWTHVRHDPDAVARRPLFIGSYAVQERWTNLRIPFYFSNTDQVTIHEDLTQLRVMIPSMRLVLRDPERRVIPLADMMLNMHEGETSWRSVPWPGPEAAVDAGIDSSQ